ncbi:MAG: M20/M25/M40 family metallo-hydrolase [Propionibacteriaceae bacterium]|jgi:acetylornithine deacetylase/succinyl-diaminopimelate desuccinylase-like protein|nr:M20/M25/M40 family metallo-hydrolase [Propionibacteriaceae bacterium]
MTLADELISDLSRMVAIPSVGALEEHHKDLTTSAELIAHLLTDAGCPDVQLLDGPAAPAIIAHFPAPAGMPTICFYAHHDVQPVGDPDDWVDDPWVLARHGDRLFGRGAADDKGGVACHLAMLRAFNGQPPVGVTIFVEGEEEIGSPHIDQFIEEHRQDLAADAYVILDAGNLSVGRPAFTTALRGVCDLIVEVKTLDHALHSGQFGGVVPDALTTLCRLLATLHTANGDVAVDGLTVTGHFDVDYSAQAIREEAGLLDGVEQIGSGTIADRLWAKPSLTVIGMDAVSVEQASNTLSPQARAKISLRVPPGMSAITAQQALADHCRRHVDWGAQVDIVLGSAGNPGEVDVDGPIVAAGMAAYRTAFGCQPVLIGQGGAIPLVGELHRAFPQAEFLVTGIADPDSRMHAPNESVSASDLKKTVQAQILLLNSLAELPRRSESAAETMETI